VWRIPLAFVAYAVLAAYGGLRAEAQAFQSNAPFAYLMDFDSGAALYEKNPDGAMAPASMSKLMTLEVVFRELKEGRLKLDNEFEVSVNAWRTGGAPSHGSAMFLAVHSKARIEDLIRGVAVQCGRNFRYRREFHRADEQARRRARPDAFDLRQPLGQGRSA
jgi:D-alanyl-D-alanine carboxypeptidase (penicillin-binding protein 5/6)